jgi:DNA-binding IclR family transcriptional regulator
MFADLSHHDVRRHSVVSVAAPRAWKGSERRQGGEIKSAIRALEILELFSLCRRPLSVTDVADQLAIPQSSSSVMLQALCTAGFVERDQQTRRYLPGIRAVFLGNWIHDQLFSDGSLLHTLDDLGLRHGAQVRLAIRSGIYALYVYVGGPSSDDDPGLVRPGSLMPICHDPLGTMLLAKAGEAEVGAVVRHANAVNGTELPAINVDSFIQKLRRCRAAGYVEGQDRDCGTQHVLGANLSTPFGIPAAIGLSVSSVHLDEHRDDVLRSLRAIAENAWMQRPLGVSPSGRPG